MTPSSPRRAPLDSPPTAKRTLACPALLALFLALSSSPALAQNPTMSDDFARMMRWLTNQTAQGLGFNAGATFDPPNEMKPWRMQPDVSLGLGLLPLDKGRFPAIVVPALKEKDPGKALPDQVAFPNMTLHLRLGLPRRTDLGLRLAGMVTPKGHKLSGETTGDGQSNTYGVGLRKHFFGGRLPLLSMGVAYNHVRGYFNFRNQFKNVELVQGAIWADSVNTGRLEWEVQSLGVNSVVSYAYRKWTPFLGVGYNHLSGTVRGKLQADWSTPLIAPSIGEATDSPELNAARIIFGAQRDGALVNFFLNAEMKAIGSMAGQTFVVSTGLAAPFRMGALSVVSSGRREGAELARRERPRRREARPASAAFREEERYDGAAARPRREAEDPRWREFRRRRSQQSPELIFLR